MNALKLVEAARHHWFLDRHLAFWRDELGLSRHAQARVIEVIDETADAKTFMLRPPRHWPGHRAGQFVPIEVEIDGVRMRRCYSISSGASEPGARQIAITIKRVPSGRVSTWFHDHVEAGDRIAIGPPAGDFVIDETGDELVMDVPRRLLLVAGGSGITPIMAIVRDLELRDALHDVVVIHAARSDADAIFARDLAAIAMTGGSTAAALRPRYNRYNRDYELVGDLRFNRAMSDEAAPERAIHIDVAARAISGESAAAISGDRGLRLIAHRDASDGYLDAATLTRLVPDLASREVYVCGPPGLLDLVTAVASAAGAPVHHERFVAAPRSLAAPNDNAHAPITIRLRGRSRAVAGAAPLLAELERAGERPAHGCRMGICATCRCRKTTGTVENLLTGAVSSAPDEDIRLCVSRALSDLELSL